MNEIGSYFWTQIGGGFTKLNHWICHMGFNDWMIVLIVGVVAGFLMLKSNMDGLKP